MMTSGRLDRGPVRCDACGAGAVDRYPVFRQRPVPSRVPLAAAALGGRPGLRPRAGTSTSDELPAPGDDRRCRTTSNRPRRPTAAPGPPAVGDPPAGRVRRRVGGLLAAAPLAGRRDRADQGAALAHRREPGGRPWSRTTSLPGRTEHGGRSAPRAIWSGRRLTAGTASCDRRLASPAPAEDAFTLARRRPASPPSCCWPPTPRRRSPACRRPGSARCGPNRSRWPRSRRPRTARHHGQRRRRRRAGRRLSHVPG